MDKPFLSSNYMKKKSPIKGASVRMTRGKANTKFSGFGSKVQNIPKYSPVGGEEDTKKGLKLVVYNLRVSVKSRMNLISKVEQLIYDFKVGKGLTAGQEDEAGLQSQGHLFRRVLPQLYPSCLEEEILS